MSKYREKADRLVSFMKMLDNFKIVNCPKRIQVICYLFEYADDNGSFSATYEQLSEKLEQAQVPVDLNTIGKAIRCLLASGLLRMVRTNRNTTGIPEYQFDLEKIAFYIG